MGIPTWLTRRRGGACEHVWQGRDGIWCYTYYAELLDGGRVIRCMICGAETDTQERRG